MGKKLSVVGLQVEPAFHEKMKAEAERKGVKISEFMRRWLESYPYGSDNVIPVVLDVPKSMIGDREALTAFLGAKTSVIADALCSRQYESS